MTLQSHTICEAGLLPFSAPLRPSAAPANQLPRVLFLNRSYWPDGEATGQLLTELCEDLAGTFDVSVLAGQPNINVEQATFRPTGTEVRHGVTIRRVPHFRFSKKTLWGRAANLLSYAGRAAVSAMMGPHADIVVTETDPPLLAVLGHWLRLLRGMRLVVYLQDIYPDVAVAMGKVREGWLTGLVRRLLIHVYRRAERVVVLSSDMRNAVIAAGVDPARVVVIPNWADTCRLRPVKEQNAFRQRLGLEDRFVVMYSGNMGWSQRLEQLLEAAALLQDQPQIHFVLVGGGAQRAALEQAAARRGLKQVQFCDYQPLSQLSVSLSAADVHFIPLDPPLVPCLMPSKLYGILASGTPVIAAAPAESELATLITREQVGCVVPPRDPAALAAQLRACANDPARLEAQGQRARQLAVREFDRSRSVARFSQLLLDVLNQKSPAEQTAPPAPVRRSRAA